jgi:aromatic ring-opening dioxygenase LigB subunit
MKNIAKFTAVRNNTSIFLEKETLAIHIEKETAIAIYELLKNKRNNCIIENEWFKIEIMFENNSLKFFKHNFERTSNVIENGKSMQLHFFEQKNIVILTNNEIKKLFKIAEKCFQL